MNMRSTQESKTTLDGSRRFVMGLENIQTALLRLFWRRRPQGTLASSGVQGRNFLDSMDFIANQILLPLGGMLIAIFVGWFMKKELITDEVGYVNPIIFKLWRFFIKFIAPVSVALIFISQIL